VVVLATTDSVEEDRAAVVVAVKVLVREGFGGGREGFAGGRGRGITWKRKDEGGGSTTNLAAADGDEGVEKQIQEQEDDNSKWEGKESKKSNPTQWGKDDGEPSAKGAAPRGGGNDHAHTSHDPGSGQNVPCENCGMFNHTTRECRRNACEICGFNNHATYDCRRCLPWNLGPELCATQVEDQSFFFIDECIDSRVVKEKASTALISVKQGAVNAKQVELEFMNLIGADAWKWKARPVADGKFLMRFPTIKMVTEWCRLKHLTMRSGAQIQIDRWSPAAAEAKCVLQTAWFRVSRIPTDQRSPRTLAKVGGLVGKVLEVDEGTRYKYDYVGLKIACRDVFGVPKTAEGTLGLYIIDFVFEREVPEEKSERTLKSGIGITEDASPPPKKTKADPPSEKPAQAKESEEVGGKQTSDINTGKGVQCYWSAPPNINFKRKSQTKLMSDAQKAYLNEDGGDMGEKVHIPDTLEDYDTDSDSFTIKV